MMVYKEPQYHVSEECKIYHTTLIYHLIEYMAERLSLSICSCQKIAYKKRSAALSRIEWLCCNELRNRKNFPIFSASYMLHTCSYMLMLTSSYNTYLLEKVVASYMCMIKTSSHACTLCNGKCKSLM